jgi:nucleotide-binding universal stress UspA family protein
MYEKILVPVDGSDTSLRGLDEAIKLGKAMGSTLRLLLVINELFVAGTYETGGALSYSDVLEALRDGAKNTLAECERTARERGVGYESALIETIGGRASDVIVTQAAQWPADLIVMGTHGRRGIRRLALGSDAEGVLRQSSVPVLMVRYDEEAST